MARWSDAMMLREVKEHRAYLVGEPGVYEIGYLRTGFFIPMYIGRARTETTCLYTRLLSYNRETCHNKFIRKKIDSINHNLWFHVIKCDNPGLREALMLNRFGLREVGTYKWNQKPEYAAILNRDSIESDDGEE